MTDLFINECEFLWKIENFSVSTIQNRRVIVSPIFESKLLEKTHWRIGIWLTTQTQDSETQDSETQDSETQDSETQDSETQYSDHMAVILEKGKTDEIPISFESVLFDIALVDKHGTLSHIRSGPFDFNLYPYASFIDFVERSAVLAEDSNLVFNDALTLKGRIWKYSSWGASPEKIFVRSKLGMERIQKRIEFRPQAAFQCININSQIVPGDFKLHLTWFFLQPVAYRNIRPPSIAIEPPKENKSWIFMSAKIQLIGRIPEPGCHINGTKDYFPCGLDKMWLLPYWTGAWRPFGYYYYKRMGLICEFTISNCFKEGVCDTKYSNLYEYFLQTTDVLSRNVIVNDMKPVLEHPTFPDVHIKVGCELIPAHRVVLSARSPIFQKILTDADGDPGLPLKKNIRSLVSRIGRHLNRSNDQIELDKAVQNSGISVTRSNDELLIAFSDVEERIMRKIVSFVYTDDVGCVDHDTAIQLLHASKRYWIKGLKGWCESFLKNTITVDNVCGTLRVADSLNCDVLKEEVLLFINWNMDCVLHRLDSLPVDNKDKIFAKDFGLCRGKKRNLLLFPLEYE